MSVLTILHTHELHKPHPPILGCWLAWLDNCWIKLLMISSLLLLLSESVIGDDADIAFADNEVHAAQVEVQSRWATIASWLHLASTLRRYATCYSLNCACETCFQILFPVSVSSFHFRFPCLNSVSCFSICHGQVVPYICIIPADDLCQVCQQNASLILRAANLSEDGKMQMLIDAQHHLQLL